jgi:hypothetical protein
MWPRNEGFGEGEAGACGLLRAGGRRWRFSGPFEALSLAQMWTLHFQRRYICRKVNDAVITLLPGDTGDEGGTIPKPQPVLDLVPDELLNDMIDDF